MNQFDYEIVKNRLIQYNHSPKHLKWYLNTFFKVSKQNFNHMYSRYLPQKVLDDIESRGLNYKAFKLYKAKLLENQYIDITKEPKYIQDKNHYVDVRMKFEDAYRLFTGKEL